MDVTPQGIFKCMLLICFALQFYVLACLKYALLVSDAMSILSSKHLYITFVEQNLGLHILKLHQYAGKINCKSLHKTKCATALHYYFHKIVWLDLISVAHNSDSIQANNKYP